MVRGKFLLLTTITSTCIYWTFYLAITGNQRLILTWHGFSLFGGEDDSSSLVDQLLQRVDIDDEDGGDYSRRSSSSSSSDNDGPMFDEDQMENVFKERRQHLVKTCRRYYRDLPLDPTRLNLRALRTIAWTYSAQRSFYVDDANKLLYCIVPKVASTTMKKLLMFLQKDSPYRSLKDIDGSLVHNLTSWHSDASFQPLSHYTNPRDVFLRLANYTKIIVVRHPMARVLSAWKSKLQGDNQVYSKYYGDKIIEKYRRNYTGSNLSDHQEAIKSNAVALREFFSFLKDDIRINRVSDVHWSLYNSLCAPCYMQYHYIAVLERWYPEVHYLMSKLLKHTRKPADLEEKDVVSVQELLVQRHTDGEKMNTELVKQLPIDLLNQVQRLYAIDFELFGYDTVKSSNISVPH